MYIIQFVNTEERQLHQVTGVKQIPDVLKALEAKKYNITLTVTEENVKEGSQVYYAAYISTPLEISDTHSPMGKIPTHAEQS